jgi:hypothetical protein
MSETNLPPGCSSAPGDEPLPRCCEDASTAECDACKGFDEDCAAYRAAMDVAADTERRFRRDYAEEIEKAERRYK